MASDESSLPTSALRAWLTRNKIFFETVSASALALAAIIVSGIQLIGLERQNTLIELQTRVAEAQALPTFEIKFDYKLNPETNYFEQAFLTISNSGGPVYEFKASEIFEIKFKASPKAAPSRDVELRIVVPDYYQITFANGALKGEISRSTSPQNHKLIRVFEDAMSKKRSDIFRFLLMDDLTTLRISYHDILNREHVEYYDVEPVSGARRLPVEQGKALFASAQKEVQIPIDKLDADEMIRNLTKMASGFDCSDSDCFEK